MTKERLPILPAPIRVTPTALHWPALTADRLAAALFAVATLLVILTFTDYGVTWDEDVHNWYGMFVLDYYTSGFTDLRALHWLDLINYGAAFDMTAAAANLLSPFGTYETRHLLNGLVGVVGLVGAWKLGRQLAGPRAGFIAALFLALTPNYYGQMFNNPKDIPFAAAVVWAIYYEIRVLQNLPRPPWAEVGKLGLAIGLALGVRVGGLVLLAYLGLLLGAFTLWRAVATKRFLVLLGDGFACFWRVLLPVVLIAYPVMLIFWPYAQEAPIQHPLDALATFSHETFPFRTLFDGQYVPASDLPWEYLPVHILLALPELILVLLAAAPVFAAATLWQARGSVDPRHILGIALVGFAVLFPVAYAVAIKAVLFDGMRHFIFVLPLIAVLTAVVADRGLAWISRLPVRPYAYGTLAVYAVAHLTIMVMLHPDEYVYYNYLIGGAEGAQGLFKLDYWANSYAEAAQGLEDYLREEYGADFMDHDFTVAVCGPPVSAAYYFPSNFIFTADQRNADFFIAFTKDNCDKSLPGREIYRVERMGTLLSVVLDRRTVLAQPARVAVTAAGK